MQKGARGGFNINGANNGILLGAADHLSGHPKYNQIVLDELGRIESEARRLGLSDLEIAGRLQKLSDRLRKLSEDGVFNPWF